MSTNSTIVVEIPKDKRGKAYQFEQGNNKYSTPQVVIPENAKYVSVYHHFDGYPYRLGADLINPENGYLDFDNIMSEIVSGGDMSVIGRPYHAWRNDDWKWVKPDFSEELPNISEEYQYLFTDKGEWLVRGKYGIKEFISIPTVIKMG